MDANLLKDLPGSELVSKGLADLEQGKMDTVEALLIAIGRPRLLRLGFELPFQLPEMPESELYRKLGDTHANVAHSQYNALIRRFVSFARALEGRQIREAGSF